MTSPLLTGARELTRTLVEATGGLYPATLTKCVGSAGIDPNNPLLPQASAKKDYLCQGFIESSIRKWEGSLIADDESLGTIIGGFLPDGVRPDKNDTLTLQGVKYTIVEVAFDSTGAVYELKLKSP